MSSMGARGALLAAGLAFLAGRASYNSFDLASGVRFNFYSAERRGIRKEVVVITGVSAAPIEHYWEDGPELTGWGAVVGKYPDGKHVPLAGLDRDVGAVCLAVLRRDGRRLEATH